MKLKIGEFSKLNQVTVKTLRHYDEIGLLRPSHVDEWTGYRYYDVCQMQPFNRIVRLKRLGFSLDEIRELIQEAQGVPPAEMIAEKLKTCRWELEALIGRIRALEELEKEPLKRQNMEQPFITALPAIIVASHRRILATHAELMYLCPNVIAPEMARLGCVCTDQHYCFTIDHEKEYREQDVDIEYCEAVTELQADSELIHFKKMEAVAEAACIYHRGSYETFPQSVARLYAYIEANGLTISDHPRFSYIHGAWDSASEQEWLSVIQIPVTH